MKVYAVFVISSGYEYYNRDLSKLFLSKEAAEKYAAYKRDEKERYALMGEQIEQIRSDWYDEHQHKNYRLDEQAYQQYDKLKEKIKRGKANNSDIKKHKDLEEKARTLADNSVADHALLQEKIKENIVGADFLYDEEKKVLLENNFRSGEIPDDYEIEEFEVEE